MSKFSNNHKEIFNSHYDSDKHSPICLQLITDSPCSREKNIIINPYLLFLPVQRHSKNKPTMSYGNGEQSTITNNTNYPTKHQQFDAHSPIPKSSIVVLVDVMSLLLTSLSVVPLFNTSTHHQIKFFIPFTQTYTRISCNVSSSQSFGFPNMKI